MESAAKSALLKRRLERLYRTFDSSFLSSDPLEFVHMYKRKEDKEVVGLIASSLAYGRVQGIRQSVAFVLNVMGDKPFGFTMRFRPERDSALFSGFVHRFNTGTDIACLIYFMRQMIEEKGSIEGFFLKGYSPYDENIKAALSAFSRNVLSLDSSLIYGKGLLPEKAGVRFFFPDPADRSPCKRLNLYLRWMVRRKDGLDTGIWKRVSPAKLIIPLDTHIARISRRIGLTSRTSSDWRMAEEVTAGLRKLDPEDPVKYDFSLCRLGILDKCASRPDVKKCEQCLIKELCVL